MADNSTDVPQVEDYNLSLHIGALFANMAASSLGVLLPILFAYTTFSAQTTSRIHSVIQTARTFGSGVILATAFIHMLPTAFGNLSDPSLPAIFQEEVGYTGWAGLIGMVSAMLLQVLEYTATQRFYSRSKKQQQQIGVHAIDRLSVINGDDGAAVDEKKKVFSEDAGSLEEGRAVVGNGAVGAGDVNPEDCLHMGHVHGGEILLVNKNNKNQHQNQHLHPHRQDVASPNSIAIGDEHHHHHHGHGGAAGGVSLQEQRSREIGTYILELGIALHSVIIGITLGTTIGAEFISLLIALLFHQFFEGIALGGRIASLEFKRTSVRPWLLSAWFAVSTPVGIAIGIGIQSTYEAESVTSLIVQGVFDACSAGILLYTSLVQLMSTEINSNVAFREASTRKQVVQFVALWSGAAAMAIVGKWA